MNNTSAGLAQFLDQADAVAMAVFLLLLAMSIASWVVILIKVFRSWQTRRQSQISMSEFWQAGSFPQAMSMLQQAGPGGPLAALAASADSAHAHYQRQGEKVLGASLDFSDFVTGALRNAISRQVAKLEWGLTLLASVGSTAPFVGLLGTVWGIYHALIGISTSGQATLDKVAGPVGEALIMTALGLAVAIPAVLAYNAFTRGNRLIIADMDGFAHDLHAWLMTGARLEHQRGPAPRHAPAGAALQTKGAA